MSELSSSSGVKETQGDPRSRPTNPMVTIAILGIHAYLYVLTIQFWWWGQIYLRTGLLLWASLLISLMVPSLLLGTQRWSTLAWISQILILPSAICVGFLLAFRLGFSDHFGRYIYRSIWLMTLFGVCFLGIIIMKWNMIRTGTPSESEHLIPPIDLKKAWVSLLLDVITTAGFSILVTNIEGVMIALYR